MSNRSDTQSLLRLSLRGNAVFSATSGLVFTCFAATVASAIGLADPRIVTAVGLNLLGFAALLAFVSSRDAIHLPTAMAIVLLDLAWVVGTVPVVLSDVLSRPGVIAAIVIADVVLVFAALQFLGIRRARASLVPVSG